MLILVKVNNMKIYSKKVIEKFGLSHVERKEDNKGVTTCSQYYIMGLGSLYGTFLGHFGLIGLFSFFSFFSMKNIVPNVIRILITVVLPFIIVFIYFIKNKLLYKKCYLTLKK